jgi:hypothetical protein
MKEKLLEKYNLNEITLIEFKQLFCIIQEENASLKAIIKEAREYICKNGETHITKWVNEKAIIKEKFTDDIRELLNILNKASDQHE